MENKQRRKERMQHLLMVAVAFLIIVFAGALVLISGEYEGMGAITSSTARIARMEHMPDVSAAKTNSGEGIVIITGIRDINSLLENQNQR